VWDCSTRDINRGYKMATYDRQAALGTATIEHLAEPVSTKTCMAIPQALALAGAIAAYAGTSINWGAICAAVATGVSAASLYAIDVAQDYRAWRYDVSDFQDCNPLQNTMAKVYCDLSCVEDAVKRGDQQILTSIGTLNRNILSEMKEFFNHYVSEIFTRLTHMEDKATHDTDQLKQVMDTYARADLNAVNSNGKQIINAMNTQHSALNKNLGIAAKQIFDLTHEEHKVIAEKMDAHLDATSDAIDKLKESTVQGFHDAFNEFTEAMASEDQDASLVQLKDMRSAAQQALAEIAAWNTDSMYKLGATKLEQIHVALTALHRQVRHARLRQQAWNGTAGVTPPVPSSLLKKGVALHREVNTIARSLLAMKANLPEPPALMDSEMKKLLKAAETSIKSHALSAHRMGLHLDVLRGGDRVHQASAQQLHIDAQLVEFDKILLKIRQSAEGYLDAAQEQVNHVKTATTITEAYLSQCSSDFLAVQLAAKRALHAGSRAAKAARIALQEVAQQVSLLADMLVDGGLVRYALQAAAEAAPPAAAASVKEGLDGVPDESKPRAPHVETAVQLLHMASASNVSKQGQKRAAALLQMPELYRIMHLSLVASFGEFMPPVLPKAQAALKLAMDLQHRHDMHGLARAGFNEAKILTAAWRRLNKELEDLSGETRVRHTALGQAFAQQLDAVLAFAAPAPSHCVLHGQDWILWDSLPSTRHASVVVRGAALLAQHARGYHHRRLDFAEISNMSGDASGSFEAMVCDTVHGSVRRLVADEMVLCFQNDARESGCTQHLSLPYEAAQQN
ncbi:unnamed protein product, partial [Symbiodinium pilosum]